MLADRLKSETRAQHDAIESTLGVLISNQLTRDRYREIVAGFYTFFAGWEPRAAAVLPQSLIPLFEERMKTALLASDLTVLGYDDAAIAALPVCRGDDAVPAATAAQVLGTMYVTEGSTLGGQIISRHLEKVLGLSDGRGYAYFSGVGPATMPRWRAFKDVLASVPSEDADAVVQSASITFEKLMKWLSARHTRSD